MSNKELLAEAYRRYPIGAIFKSTISDKGIERVVEPYHNEDKVMKYKIIDDEGKQRVYVVGGMNNDKGGCSNPTLYKDGQWAGDAFINYEIY